LIVLCLSPRHPLMQGGLRPLCTPLRDPGPGDPGEKGTPSGRWRQPCTGTAPTLVRRQALSGDSERSADRTLKLHAAKSLLCR
jgi:hypothetical protein